MQPVPNDGRTARKEAKLNLFGVNSQVHSSRPSMPSSWLIRSVPWGHPAQNYVTAIVDTAGKFSGQSRQSMPQLAYHGPGRDGASKAALLDGVNPRGFKGVPRWGPPGGQLCSLSGSVGQKARGCQGPEGVQRSRRVGGDVGLRRRYVSDRHTVKFAGAVYALHAFQKRSKKGIKTPPVELDIVRKRLKAAEEHHAKRRAEENQDRGSSHH